jgi:hypothetical protein
MHIAQGARTERGKAMIESLNSKLQWLGGNLTTRPDGMLQISLSQFLHRKLQKHFGPHLTYTVTLDPSDKVTISTWYDVVTELYDKGIHS